MYILTVIPITNNPHIDTLTYFSLKNILPGSLVQVPIRNKDTPAIVIHSNNAIDMKSTIRKGNFAIKKITTTTKIKSIVPASFIQTAEYMSKYYATNIGSIINTMIPKILLSNEVSIELKKPKIEKATNYGTYALQVNTKDRIMAYKLLIEEELTHGNSIMLISSSIENTKYLFIQLSNIFEDSTYMLTSKNTKKKQSEIFNNIHTVQKPVLLIATAKYALLFREDISTIILEDESSKQYQTLRKPYMSTSHFIEKYAELSKIRLIFTNILLSTRIYDQIRNRKITLLDSQNTHEKNSTEVHIVDMRTKKEEIKETINEEELQTKRTNKFSMIDKALHAKISEGIKDNKKIFILVPRRGIAPITICADCRSPVICDNCDTPITLHTTKNNTREFLCYKCGETKDANKTCIYCDSWRLNTLGIGIEGVEAELKKKHKDIDICRIDKTTTRTNKLVQTTLDKYVEHGSILIGTQLVIPFLAHNSSIDTSIIVSLDSMLSIPNFDIDERVFSLLLEVKDLTKDTLYIQTRMPDRSVLSYTQDVNIPAFINEELALREILKYPPYTVMVKIIRTGSKKQIIQDFQNILPSIKSYKPKTLKKFYQISHGKFALQALLRIPREQYPNKNLTEILKSIQPMFEVRVDIE